MSRKKKPTLKDMPLGDDEGEYTEKFRKSLLRSAREVMGKGVRVTAS